jgi:predicted ATPase with chaperone activity
MHAQPGQDAAVYHRRIDRVRLLEVQRHLHENRAADAFPACFQLVAAMNPCPCGWAGDRSGRCGCSRESIARYRGRVSVPLLDRIDLHVAVPPGTL